MEVKTEREDGSKLVEHVTFVGMVNIFDGSGNKFMELVVIDAPVVGSVGSAEDCVGDVRAYFVGDDFGDAFSCANNRLVDLVDVVSFVLCISLSDDSQEHVVLQGGCCICTVLCIIDDRFNGSGIG